MSLAKNHMDEKETGMAKKKEEWCLQKYCEIFVNCQEQKIILKDVLWNKTNVILAEL